MNSGNRSRELAGGNLMYREPALHDHLTGDDGAVIAELLASLLGDHGSADARTVLDLGCGTGVHAQVLGADFDYLGVDVQPWLIQHARRTHPAARFEVGDITCYRAGRRFDVITCVGNTLAYLHTDAELEAACVTIASHSTPETLIVLQTLVSPPPVGHAERTVKLPRGQARVVLDTAWDQETWVVTTTRTWSLPEARADEVVTDKFSRRVRSLEQIQTTLNRVGLEVVETYDDPRRREPARGPVAYVVARRARVALSPGQQGDPLTAVCQGADQPPGEKRRAP
jgi:SAM-dependent methyltransferase